MRHAALLLVLATLTVSGCSGYTPSQANCFSFVARGPSSDPACTFTPLGGGDMTFTAVSEARLARALHD